MKTIFWVIAAPFLHFFLHFFYQRIVAPFRPSFSQQKWVAILGVFTSLLCAALASSTLLNGLYVGIASFGFCHFYFHVFNLSETARRIHILRTYYAAAKKGRETKLDPNQYNPTVMIKQRIERLLSAGALHLENGLYSTRPGFLLVAAKIIRSFRRFF